MHHPEDKRGEGGGGEGEEGAFRPSSKSYLEPIYLN